MVASENQEVPLQLVPVGLQVHTRPLAIDVLLVHTRRLAIGALLAPFSSRGNSR